MSSAASAPSCAQAPQMHTAGGSHGWSPVEAESWRSGLRDSLPKRRDVDGGWAAWAPSPPAVAPPDLDAGPPSGGPRAARCGFEAEAPAGAAGEAWAGSRAGVGWRATGAAGARPTAAAGATTADHTRKAKASAAAGAGAAARAPGRWRRIVEHVLGLAGRHPYLTGALVGATLGLPALALLGASWAGAAFVCGLSNTCGGAWRAAAPWRAAACKGAKADAGSGAPAPPPPYTSTDPAGAPPPYASAAAADASLRTAPPNYAAATEAPIVVPRASRAVPMGLGTGLFVALGTALTAAAWPAAVLAGVVAGSATAAAVALLARTAARGRAAEASPATSGRWQRLVQAARACGSNPFRMFVVCGLLAAAVAFGLPSLAATTLVAKLSGVAASAFAGMAASFLWTRNASHLAAAGGCAVLAGIGCGLGAVAAGLPGAAALALACAAAVAAAIVVYGLCAMPPGLRAVLALLLLCGPACWLGTSSQGLALVAALQARCRGVWGGGGHHGQ